MEREQTEGIEADSLQPRWQKLNGLEKITALAQDIVLAVSQRTLSRKPKTPVPEVLPLRKLEPNVEQPHTNQSSTMEPNSFPVPAFMILLSLTQVPLMYIAKNDVLVRLFGYDPYRRYELWRFITIMLVHTGLIHLWTNVLPQLLLGGVLEIRNWTHIAIIYFASLLGGSLFITVLNPKVYAVGATAGVYGLLISHLSTIALSEKNFKLCRLIGVLLYILIDIAVSLNLETVNTNYAGHLGGGITGFLVSILVLKTDEKHQWIKKMQKICFGILASLCVIIILVNIFATDLYLPTEWNSHYENSYRDYILKLAVGSPEDSAIRKFCSQDLKCKLLLNQLIFDDTSELQDTTKN